MTIFAGTRPPSTVLLNPSAPGFGPTAGPVDKLALRSPMEFSTRLRPAVPPGAPGLRRMGAVKESFGGTCLFERVLVVPQIFNAGAVLSPLVFTVDIWNTFRQVEQILTGLIETGPGSASVALPTLPVPFAPLESIAVVVTLPTVGDADIAESIEFVFPGLSGTTLTILGNRLALFSIQANWEDGIDEKPQLWMTDVMRAVSESEQRLALRSKPRSQVKMRVTPDRLEKAILEALLWGWQNQIYGVPFWPDAHPLLGNAAEGATVLLLDTSNRGFVPGALMAIWRDAGTYEVQEVVALVSGGVQISPKGTNMAWAGDGRTLCIPVRRGRLSASQEIKRTTSRVAELELTFDCEVV